MYSRGDIVALTPAQKAWKTRRKNQKEKVSCEVTGPTEIGCRIKNPKKFDKRSFRRKPVGKSKTVALVVACPKGKFDPKKTLKVRGRRVKGKCKVGMRVQSIRFKRNKFTVPQAKRWVGSRQFG